MHKKIGILTLNGYRNYGNVLQNYALQTFLKSEGYDTKTFWYVSSESNQTIAGKIRTHLQQKNLLSTLKYQFLMRTSSVYKRKERLLAKREINFKKFTDQYIEYTSLVPSEKHSKEANNEFDAVLVGSDQVWGLNGTVTPTTYFLPFVDVSKRNSFAASFGFTDFPNKKVINGYKKGIESMNRISVREYEGKKIVESLTDKKATVLLDPVFLLPTSDWKNMSMTVDVEKDNGKFLLVYLLGEKTKEWTNIISEISEKFNLAIIELNDLDNQELYEASPQKFIRLFSNAGYVITDSFHGAAFSMIFKRPFIVVNRVDKMVNMNSRLKTLLTRFQLMDRFYSEKEDITKIISSQPNYQLMDKVIEKNRKESCRFVNSLFDENG